MKFTFVWVVGIGIAAGIGFALLVLHHTRLGGLLRRHVPDTARRRMLLANAAFIATFLFLRGLTYCIHNNIGPFHDVEIGGKHIHHLVWGILGMMGVGFAWLAEVGTGDKRSTASVFSGRLLALLYGAAAALTLDEFALWWNLSDVYWAKQGKESIDAGIIFASLLSLCIIAMPLFKAVKRLGTKAFQL